MLRAELYQFIHTRVTWLYALISVLLSLVLTFGEPGSDSARGIYEISLTNVPMTLIVSYLFCAVNYGQEFRQRIISRELAAGTDRYSLVLGKYAAFLILTTVLNLTPVICNSLLGTLLYGYGDGPRGQDAGLFAMYILLCGAMCTIPFMVAFLVRETGKNLVFSLLFYFVSIYLLNSSSAQTLAHFIPIGQMRLLLMRLSTWREAAATGILWISCPLAAAVMRFRFCELH